MQIINVMSKSVADELLSLGFHYNTQKIDNKEIYSFIATDEIVNILNSKYDKGSFFMGKYCNFAS